MYLSFREIYEIDLLKKEKVFDIILPQFFLANHLSKNKDFGLNIRLRLIDCYIDLSIDIGQYDDGIIDDLEMYVDKKNKIINNGIFTNLGLMQKIIQMHEKNILVVGYNELRLYGTINEEPVTYVKITIPVTLHELMYHVNELKNRKFNVSLSCVSNNNGAVILGDR
uniref:Uncharacterized protein n=1 Tax=viral metagenome TaxID=1070528 RepID=A0A6C0C845_9ZZZZ